MSRFELLWRPVVHWCGCAPVKVAPKGYLRGYLRYVVRILATNFYIRIESNTSNTNTLRLKYHGYVIRDSSKISTSARGYETEYRYAQYSLRVEFSQVLPTF